MFSRQVFIHIPKCGGNSVEAKLRFNNIPFTRINPGDLTVPVPETGLITGHISYDQFKAGNSTLFFTVIRNPLERAISHYYYNMKIGDGSPEYPMMKDLGIERFLLEYTPDNMMCRNMFGDTIFDSPLPDEEKYRRCTGIMQSKYLFIGSTYHLDSLDSWIMRWFGGQPFLVHENMNQHPTEVADNIVAAFMQRNVIDFMIYRFIGRSWENPAFVKAPQF